MKYRCIEFKVSNRFKQHKVCKLFNQYFADESMENKYNMQNNNNNPNKHMYLISPNKQKI